MNNNQDIVNRVGSALSELDYLFQEGVMFTPEEQKTLSNYAEQLSLIIRELNVSGSANLGVR